MEEVLKMLTKIKNGMVLFYSKSEECGCFGCVSSNECAEGSGPMMYCFKDKVIKDAKTEPEVFLKERRF